MAGKNIVLKAGQTLFRQGDASNGMFLVRKGVLKVYLEKEGKKVELAKVEAGGMIGEMALFDNKPRSASVAATDGAEVTLISNQDFAKLMKQIPKWFTALMGTLSGRLRATNDRLEKIQADSAPAMQGIKSAMRILLVVDLLFHRDGEKDGKEWMLNKGDTISMLSTNFAEDQALIDQILKGLVEQDVIKIKKNKYNAEVISASNRGKLTRFLNFLGTYMKTATEASLPEAGVEMLRATKSLSERAAYDSFSVPFDELAAEGRRLRLKTIPLWGEQIASLKCITEGLQLVKSGETFAIKTTKKDIKEILANHSTLYALAKEMG